jgi:hypothetical protein
MALWIQTSPPRLRSYYEIENFFFGRGGANSMSARECTTVPETTKAKLATSTLANHWQWEMALKDPEARLTAELVLWYRTLQERFPGAHTLAQSRKRAQSGRRLRSHQLLDGSKLMLTKQKQQANQHPDARGMSLARLPFCTGTSVPSEPYQQCLDLRRSGPREKLAKIKVLLYERLRMPSEACPQRTLLRNKSKGTITPCTCFAS